MRIILTILAGLVIAGCAVKMHGRMTCEGKCELVVDREVSELNPIPLPQLPKDKEK